MNFIVQGSSRSWSGSPDSCMNLVDGSPVIYWTLRKLLENFPEARIVIAAPLFDRGGELHAIVQKFNGRVSIFFGYDASPLLRMLGAHSEFFQDEKYFIRIDALNMFFKPEDLVHMYSLSTEGSFDCVKFPDDYPVQFTVDVYKAEALAQMKDVVSADSPFVIHPKYFMVSNPNFKTCIYREGKLIAEDLFFARAKAKDVYLERDELNAQAIETGDQLYFHYTLALPYVKNDDKVLDVACGTGFGLVRLATKAGEVYGADVSEAAITSARRHIAQVPNIKLFVEDATILSFGDATFDIVTSFETLEHVDTAVYVREMWRVLKPEGKLIVSTPQNSRGECPVNPHHRYEYSLEEFKHIFDGFFEAEKIIGIKQGTIIIDDDPYGTNTFAVFRKKGIV